MAFKIYTKTGDKGSTALIGGTRVSKAHIRIETYGTIDELNAYIGLVADLVKDDASIATLRRVQDRLFTIGSQLASDPQKEIKMKLPEIHAADIDTLESEIDRMDEVLPAMRSFILPGGGQDISTIHIARCVCRRAERLCVHMMEHNEKVDEIIIQYLNRLSDYLFVLARYITHLQGKFDIPWVAETD